jgi:hypothetical protein
MKWDDLPYWLTAIVGVLTHTFRRPSVPVHLIAPEALSAMALLVGRPCLAWIVSTELRVLQAGGPLADLCGESLVGKHVYELAGTDQLTHPTVGAIHEALEGFQRTYEIHWHGFWWEVRVAPIMGARRILGVLGLSTTLQTVDEAEPGDPVGFEVMQETTDGWHERDRVLIRPGAAGRCQLMRDVEPERVTRHLMDGDLRPLTKRSAEPDAPFGVGRTGPRGPRLARVLAWRGAPPGGARGSAPDSRAGLSPDRTGLRRSAEGSE